MILGKKESHRGLMGSRGLFSEKTASPLQPILLLTREIMQLQCAYVHTTHIYTHTWGEQIELYQRKFLFEWMLVEKHFLLCGSII